MHHSILSSSLRGFALAMLICPLLASYAVASVPAGVTPNEAPPDFGGVSSWAEIPDNGDLKFSYEIPSASELSSEELYILFGGENSDGYVEPWWQNVLRTVIACESESGDLPHQLDLTLLDGLTEDDELRLTIGQVVTSPITGSLPTLDSDSPSPGNLYVHKLTPAEKDYISQYNSHYQQMWQEGKSYSAETKQMEDITLLSDAYYYRVYGNNGVIKIGIYQIWTENFNRP